jgi:cytochrome-b5 reductase
MGACFGSDAAADSSEPTETADNPVVGKKQQLTVTATRDVNYNTKLISFSHEGGVSIPGSTSAILCSAPVGEGGAQHVRPYTPLSSDASSLDLMVKVYEPSGRMSKHLGALAVGDSVEYDGPKEKLAYSPNMKRSITMLAGGTGITPCMQLIRLVLDNPDDSTKLTLVYANTEERDILQRDTLEAWAADSADQLTLVLVLSSPPDGWSGLSGRIDRPKLEAVEDVAAGPSDDVLVCVCGPPAMYDSICGARGQDEELGILGELGLTKESIFKF